MTAIPTLRENEEVATRRFRPMTLTAGWAASLLLLLGAALRLARYLHNRSLWDDEASLAFNIVSLPIGDLFRPLKYDQSAPYGFLLLERWMVNLLGPGELALRLVPLLAGLISLPLFWFVARRLLPARSALAALLLFVVSETLTYYASEVKQYSVDVAVTLAVLASFLAVDWARPRRWRLAVVMAVCCLSMWLSHPAVFVVTGAGLPVLINSWRQSRPLAGIGVVGAACAIQFGICYAVSMTDVAASAFMLDFWSAWGGFMPSPPTNSHELQWFIKTFTGYFTDPGGLREIGVLGMLVTGVGVVYFWHNDRQRLAWLVVPILLVLVASALRRYPFPVSSRDFPPYPGRLILFTVPLMFLLVAAGLERIARMAHHKAPIIALIILALLAATPALLAAKRLVEPPGHMSLREELDHVRDQMRQGDLIYLHWSAQPSYNFYRLRANLPRDAVRLGAHSRDDWKGYEDDVAKLAPHDRVWLVFLHHPDFNIVNEMRTFDFLLRRGGATLESQSFASGEVWLWTSGRTEAAAAGDMPRKADAGTAPGRRQ